MFENFDFTKNQIEKYFAAALKDWRLANKTKEPELAFYACYNVVVKTAMAVCSCHGIRVKSRTGHHIKLIEKLAEFLEDENIEIVANKMRMKRNRDLYDGGVLISEKEANYYINFCKDLLNKADYHIFPDKLL